VKIFEKSQRIKPLMYIQNQDSHLQMQLKKVFATTQLFVKRLVIELQESMQLNVLWIEWRRIGQVLNSHFLSLNRQQLII